MDNIDMFYSQVLEPDELGDYLETRLTPRAQSNYDKIERVAKKYRAKNFKTPDPRADIDN